MAIREDGRMERPIAFTGEMVRAILDGRKSQTRRVAKPQPGDNPRDDGYESTILARCPYGRPGDLLWVKETWCGGQYGTAYFYKSDWQEHDYGPRWKSQRFMPRKASRILLEVTGVRVERVRDISIEDACDEGIYQKNPTWEDICPPDPREDFEELWDSINGKKPGKSWDDNPWVWVIEFKRVEP
jgi:hypothetical protein